MNLSRESGAHFAKTVKRIFETLWWIAIVLLAVMMFSIMGAKIKGRVPQIFGYSVVNIISGSMEDTIPEGSYILVQNVAPEEVKNGDIICFYSSDPSISGLPNTHRVVEEPIIRDSGIEFVTKGDANAVKDKYTAKGDQLVGRYVKNLDGLAAFVSLLNGGGFGVLLVILQVMMVAMAVSSFVRARKSATEETAENKKVGENTLSKEEIQKIIGDNPELVKEIEAKLGLSSKSSENNRIDT